MYHEPCYSMYRMSNNTLKTGVLFFVKYPSPGMVKKRLANQCNNIQITELYRLFVLDILETLKKTRYSIIICYYPSKSYEFFIQWLGNDYTYLPQQGTSLGEKMQQVFYDGFSLGYQQLLLIGSDIPDIPQCLVEDSSLQLDSHDVVIGPSIDGGYYLIGCKYSGFEPGIFRDIPWSTSQVFAETIKRLITFNKKTYVLPPWQDVDTKNDLLALYNRNQTTRFKHSKTMSYLRQQIQDILSE